jgi:hypothetical protein
VEELRVKDADFAGLSIGILRGGDSIRFKAHGSSMFPLIRDGDLLTIQPLNPGEVKLKQVIFYQTAGEKLIVHRVIRIEPQDHHRSLTVRGDASPGSEEWIREEQALGQVVRIHRGNKHINLNRNIWWIMSRYFPGFLPFIYFVVRIERKLRRNPHFSNRKPDIRQKGE